MEDEYSISRKIKPLTLDNINTDWNKLIKLKDGNLNDVSNRCRIGLNIIDYFTFTERLRTKGKYNASFFDFLNNIDEFKKKKFISNMLDYYEKVKNKNKTKNQYVVYKEVYNVCISAINAFRPIMAMEIYQKYNASKVLDFTCGWGGRAIGAAAMNIDTYTGIDINCNLSVSYGNLMVYLSEKSNTQINLTIADAITYDYSSLEYDLVLSSPPYYFLEKYSNNMKYDSKQEMNEQFYKPLFLNSYKYLKEGGYFCLNINSEIYQSVCISVLGEAFEILPMKKSERSKINQKQYQEFIYVWKKKHIKHHP